MKRILRVGERYALSKHKRKQTIIRYFSLLAVLTSMCLYAVKQVSAQQAGPAATAVADIKPLQIGDTIPEWLWYHPLQVVNHPDGKDTITLNDYRGKLIILDFWATWCGSCIASMPTAYKIQNQFQADLAIIPATYEPIEKAREFLHQNVILKDLELMSVAENSVFPEVFPHKVIPHYVWITAEGVFSAASMSDEITPKNIQAMMNGNSAPIKLKVDLDPSKPLFIDHGLITHNPISYFSILVEGFYGGLPAGPAPQYDPNGAQIGVSLTNKTLMEMYVYCLYPLFKQKGGFSPEKRLIAEIPDTSGLHNKVYSFSFTSPRLRRDSFYHLIVDELNRVSGYSGTLETRNVDCYVLQHRGRGFNFESLEGEKVNTIFQSPSGKTGRLKGYPMSYLIAAINRTVFKSDHRFLVDGTGFNGMVDISISLSTTSLEGINEQLKPYGLEIKQQRKMVDMFVFNNQPND